MQNQAVVGVNCALGTAQVKHLYKSLVDLNPGWCHAYPNAGLPTAMGGYNEDPEIFSTTVSDYAMYGLLELVEAPGSGNCLIQLRRQRNVVVVNSR